MDEFDDYKDDFEADPCDHEEYDIDILTGRAECQMCPHSWYPSREEIDAEIRRHADYSEWCARENRRERLSNLLAPARRIIAWAASPFRRRDSLDDGIPF